MPPSIWLRAVLRLSTRPQSKTPTKLETCTRPSPSSTRTSANCAPND